MTEQSTTLTPSKDGQHFQYDMAPQPLSFEVLKEKYCKGDEKTERDIFRRVAKGVASVEKTPQAQAFWEDAFFQMMVKGGVGAGRIMSAAGTGVQSTLMNCFVIPVGDALTGKDHNGLPGIYEALAQSAETLRRGGGVGYDYSAIRPKGAMVKSVLSRSSGPCSYMDVFDKSCKTIESAGVRRGAQMGVLRVDHPDIMEFIQAKREPGRWNNFNVSVNVSDAFMEALEAGADWELVHEAQPHPDYEGYENIHQRADGKWVYKTMPAQELWDTIMKSNYDFAEPGVLFLDRANAVNNLAYCETFDATNPCAEQPLPAYGACDLGPINLTRFVKKPFKPNWEFETSAFENVVATMVRFLDNVLDLTLWPLEQQRESARLKRRIGIGFTGLGDMLVMMGLKYDSPEARQVAGTIAAMMAKAAYSGSRDLANERSSFPLFDETKFNECSIVCRKLNLHPKQLRNSHLISIAPTGTTSIAFFDNVSNGIEPAFSWTYDRKKRNDQGGFDTYPVEDYAFRLYKKLVDPNATPETLPDYFQSAMDISVDAHVAMLEAVQPYVDSSISKTVNIPEDYSFEDFKSLYIKAYRAGLKGLSTYRPNSILGSVLSVPTTENKEAPKEEPQKETVMLKDTMIHHRPEGRLHSVTEKIKYYTADGEKKIYVIVSFIPEKNVFGDMVHRPVEFFMPVGQPAASEEWVTTTMRLLSLAARGGMLDRALEDMRKVTSDKAAIQYGYIVKEDGTRRPRWHDSEVSLLAYAIQEIIKDYALVVDVSQEEAVPAEESLQPQIIPGKKCNECGAHAVVKRDGCEICTSCGAIGSCG